VSNTHKAYQRLKDHIMMEHIEEYEETMHNLDGIFDEHKVLTLYDEADTLPPTLAEVLERK
jgi:uncharacterized protein YabN with tetrapyrrole methylase and pyrophosphatase domain